MFIFGSVLVHGMYYRSLICLWSQGAIYSRTCPKRPHKKNTKIGFQDISSLNAGQKFCRMFQGEHSAKLSTFIKLPFAINIFVFSIFEWPLKPDSHCAGVATVHPDAGQPVYRDAPGHIS